MNEIIFDTPIKHFDGNIWCHLIASNLELLHSFARQIGLKKEWFQVSHHGIPHYDIKSNKVRSKAIELGAVQVERREFYKSAQIWYMEKA